LVLFVVGCTAPKPVHEEGGIDAGDNDACVVSGAEICNGVDDDCNGWIDDGSAIVGCPAGGLHQEPVCEEHCSLACTDYYLDCDDALGCELDGITDEANCGECGFVCLHPGCSLGRCAYDYVGVSVAMESACGLRGSGAVECWGDNETGQLGDGTKMNDRATPAPVIGLTDAAQISAGPGFTCALRRTGIVSCWGANGSGQLGNGTMDPSLTPVPVRGVNDAVEVRAMHYGGCARRASGLVSCWGANGNGQLGNATTRGSLTPVTVGNLDDADQLVTGNTHVCARRASDHSMVCWGANDYAQIDATHLDLLVPERIDIGPVLGMAAGFGHTCALRKDTHDVVCWGANDFGQLGNNSLESSSTPVVAMTNLTNVVAIFAGCYVTCAMDDAGAVACWGRGTYGELGNGTPGDVWVGAATQLPSAASTLDVGSNSACAVLATHALYCWGRNNHGQIGDSTMTDRFMPVPIIDP
jgi:alpha-tubulin suppressor-like RCC1 family protein